MILTCPQCATRYLLPAHTLSPEGRRVKCSSCNEVWFQLPDKEESETAASGGFGDIPQGVRPLPEGGNLPIVQDDGSSVGGKRERIFGYAAAAGVFLIIFAGLLFFQSTVMAKAPGMKPLYVMMGRAVEDAPRQIVIGFSELQARTVGQGEDEKISITGLIVNHSGAPQNVPMIEAHTIDGEGDVMERFHIRPPQPTINDGDELSFSAEYEPSVFDPAQTISLNFVE